MRLAESLAVILSGVVAAAQRGDAREIMVEMRNMDATGAMVFVPAFVQTDVNDTVHFVVVDKGHKAQPIPGMMPEGVSAPPGVMNQDYLLRLSKPGFYGIKCGPHFSMGMVALVKAGAGAAPNGRAATLASSALPGLAKLRMEPMLATAEGKPR